MDVIPVTTVPRRVLIQAATVLVWEMEETEEAEAVEGASGDFRDMAKIAQTHFHRCADFKAWRGTPSPALIDGL